MLRAAETTGTKDSSPLRTPVLCLGSASLYAFLFLLLLKGMENMASGNPGFLQRLYDLVIRKCGSQGRWAGFESKFSHQLAERS